jgi:hypothetical protein
MFAQSKPYLEMIELVAQLEVRHGLKVGAVNNEAHELNAYRIRTSKLDGFVDFSISSYLDGHGIAARSCPVIPAALATTPGGSASAWFD